MTRTRNLCFSSLALLVWIFAAGQVQAWPKGQAQAGAQGHKEILSRFGGEIENAPLSAYVRGVANRIISRTRFAKERWTVTVLDSPVVNAFATQGGYIYVTRGLLALANSEAELAAVLGHEMAHITENHVKGRQKRGKNAGLGVLLGAVVGGLADGKDGLKKGIELGSKLAGGYVGQYSQKQEFDADRIGMRYMVAAGYDPLEAAKFLSSMAAKHKLEADIAGREYNPNQVDISASHPATGDRVNKALQFAQSIELRGLLGVNEAAFMRAIDGMIYGDSARQGFVRGRRFTHPVLKFRFDVPDRFVITNSAAAVVSRGPNGSTFAFESGGRAEGRMSDFFHKKWVPALAKKYKIGQLSQIKTFNDAGTRGATAFLPMQRKNQNWVVQMTLVEHNGRFYRLTGIARANDRSLRNGLATAARSFRRLSDREARNATPYRVQTMPVRGGDSLSRLTRQMPPMAQANARFLTMNGLTSAQELLRGDIVKVITE